MAKRKRDLNTVYISERLWESLRPISRCALTTVMAPMGYGKTTAVNVARLMVGQLGARFAYGTDSNLLRWNDSTAAMVCDHYAQNGTLAMYQSLKVVSVQDLGSEPRETLYMGNRHEVMREFLELRGDTPGRFTIITSNFNYATIRKAYGDRVWSRLHQMCNYVELVGDDMRVGVHGDGS